jgi:hypothetical protein
MFVTNFFAFLFMLVGSGNLYAASVSAAAISIDRYDDGSANFNSDVWGTVSEFQSITLNSPLNNSYSLSLAEEGDQWDSGEQGSEAAITSEFTDGIYSFDVVYTDTTTETVFAELGNLFPLFPSSLALTGSTVSWDSWLSPGTFSGIELSVAEIGSDAAIFEDLDVSVSSYVLPSDFLQSGSQYEIELWFLSSEFQTSHKASISTLTATVIPIPAAVWLFGSALALLGWVRHKAT